MKAFYSKDRITIYCGRAEDILPNLPDGYFATLVWDAPFAMTEERIDAIKCLKADGMAFSLGQNIPSLVPQPAFGHPTVRPLEGMKQLLESCAEPIIDPYMGTGTTLVAAKMLNREAVGIERNEKDCRTAMLRLEAVSCA